MEIGIFLKTFPRATLGEALDAVLAHGLKCIQFNMTCAGLAAMPDEIPSDVCALIERETQARNIAIAAVSGTFNMIHPDPVQRSLGLKRLRVLAAACGAMGTSIITLCTGTRDPEDMWRRHPDNDKADAWKDLTAAFGRALDIADEFDITLAFEPEVANVVDSARKARWLLDDMESRRLKVVLDPANLFHAGELPRMCAILDEAFDLLGGDIILAHAKDLDHDGEAGHKAAGQGVLDYAYYLEKLRSIKFAGPLILHSLQESQVDQCVAFLREKLSPPR